MRISASIMAHPDRLGAVHMLTKSLGQEVPTSWDTEGPASGNADRVWRNARAAWEMHDPSADWHVLIQDDALVCEDFLAGMTLALGHLDDREPRRAVVSAYLGKGRHVSNRWDRLAERADETGAAWVRTMKLMWGVCIAIPVAAIPEMIGYGDKRAGVPDDMRVAGWAERTGLDVWYTWPSLVDHRPIPSLTKHNATDRRARRHHAGSATEIDWSGPVVTDPMLIRRRGARSAPTRSRRPGLRGVSIE